MRRERVRIVMNGHEIRLSVDVTEMTVRKEGIDWLVFHPQV